jgi:hypothetical protein
VHVRRRQGKDAVKDYKGFRPRPAYARASVAAEYAAGRRQRPVVCEACGKDHGMIEAHSEDYREPFGPHIGAYSLCRGCHVMVHRRFRNPSAWRSRPSGPRTAHASRQTHLTDQFSGRPASGRLRGQADSDAPGPAASGDRGCRAAIHRRAWFRTRCGWSSTILGCHSGVFCSLCTS